MGIQRAMWSALEAPDFRTWPLETTHLALLAIGTSYGSKLPCGCKFMGIADSILHLNGYGVQ
eukprot:693297-Pelagomonas_calceolata.AAC.3